MFKDEAPGFPCALCAARPAAPPWTTTQDRTMAATITALPAPDRTHEPRLEDYFPE